MKKSRLAERYRVTRPDSFRLKSIDPEDCAGLQSEEKAHARLAEGIERINELQAKLYAEHKWSLLLVIQAMDAAGKDSLIKHVMTGINPQGTIVEAFKQPSTEELNHDFLWRCQVRLPSAGHIGIFNRSYYEEVLVVRVHPEYLEAQHLPEKSTGQGHLEEPLQGHPQLGAVPLAQRHRGAQVLPPRLQGRAEEALPRAPRRARQELEVLRGRRQGAGALEAVHERLRGHDPEHQHRRRTLVRRAGEQQVVHRAGRRRGVVDALESLKSEFPVLDGKHKRELAAARRALT
jgi:hypothetical protein